nr:putative transposase (putative), gypsy type [Tanacetum cinerariifolium]
MPAGKIGVYTRFFEYANFRLPLSIFLVNVLKHYRIHISQLYVIGAAKVSHFEIPCRVHGFEPRVGLFRCFYVNFKNKGWMSFSKCQGSDAVCYTKPLDSLKCWNDHFFWIDAFACHVLFLWHTSKSVSRDVIPKSSEFSPKHYATLVAYSAPFHKYPEPFLCLVGMSRNYILDENTYLQILCNDDEEMDLLSFICTVDPTKVRIGERQCEEDEPKLLETTVERVVSLLPVAPDSSSGELEASVEKLFSKGGNGEQAKQGDSASGGRGVGIDVVVETSVEDVALAQLKRQKKRKTKLLMLKEQRPRRRGDRSNKTSMPIIMIATTSTPTADPAAIAKEKLVGSSVFGADSPFVGGSHPIPGGFSDCSGSDFLIGGIRTVIDPDSNLQKVYIPQWNATNGFCLDDSGVCREMVDEFAPFIFFASVRGMDHDQVFTEFNVGAARQISLTAEVRMRAEYNIKERRRLNSVVEEKDSLLKSRCEEIESLKAQLLVKETEAARLSISVKPLNSQLLRNHSVMKHKFLRNATLPWRKRKNNSLADQVHKLEASFAGLQEKVTVYEECMSQLEKFQDEKMEEVNEKFDKLCVDFVDMALHFEEKFYPHLLTTISGHRWLLTHGLELAIAKCLNSIEYLCALGAPIGKVIEKGMHEGLSAGITHGVGRKLTDVAAYNPSAEADYLSALHRLQSVNFSLIAELKANKDASVETITNLLRLEDALAEKLGLVESQPHVDQLMVPIHHSSDQRVIGASALSLSLDVYSSRVRKIKENIANHVSALRGVFVPLSKHLSVMALEGKEGTSGAAPDTTTALSVTSVSASTIPPISTDEYEVVHTDGQEGTGAGGETVADESVVPFPNVSDTELDIL